MSDRAEGRRQAESRWGDWMAHAQRGDSQSYEMLLREVLPGLRELVRGRLGDSLGVEDVVQNVLLSVHRARHTYQAGRPFGPWLRAIARNAVVDAQRARTRRSRRETPSDELDQLAIAPPESPGGDGLSPRLQRALESLPAAQREAVELIHLRDLSVAEAAEQVGVTPGALRVRAHRGYRALRARLTESTGGDGE